MTTHLMECARVFVNATDNSLFVIKCDYCDEEYREWWEYVSHFQDDHMPDDDEGRGSHAIAISVSGNTTKQPDSDTDFQMTGNVEEDEEHLDCDRASKECMYESTDELDTDLEVETGPNLQSSKMKLSSAPLNTTFFRLRKTPSKIMLQFIDILRQHPIQWNIKNPYFADKDKRDESSLDLSVQLRQHLRINITPQGARSSALAIIRWFKSEYMRFLACEEQDLQFVCLRGEYFEKLLQFLPHKHLQILTCDECQRRFKSEHYLLSHKYKRHNGRVPFTCRYCGRGFIHPSSHCMHENRHIKINLWPCSECLYQATSKADYFKHLNSHSPCQPFKCDICGLVYKTSTNLNVHRKRHGPPQYKCNICQKQFYVKYRYKRHLWLHEDRATTTTQLSVGVKFQCSICGRHFTSNNTLSKHMSVHMLENYNLEGEEEEVSQNIRDDMELYYCDYCTLEFINSEAYEMHMKLKHKTEIK